MIMLQMLMVLLGGALGATVRWGMSEAWRRRTEERPSSIGLGMVPWPTLVANILASFLVGLFVPVFARTPGLGDQLHLLGVVGFCGGLSTLSTAAFEILDFGRRGTTVVGVSYALLSCGSGLAALWLGLVIAS